jgi:hypothetical protein
MDAVGESCREPLSLKLDSAGRQCHPVKRFEAAA